MSKIILLGELMLRLSPPEHNRFLQAESFEVNYGGAEANVAAALAQLGHEVTYVTKLPANDLGDAALNNLRKCGVNCSYIVRGGNRLGVYYLENGASVRPSKVIYDRDESAFATADISEFDFDNIFKGANLLHVSGITPVLTDGTAAITMEALKKAKEYGVTISFDLNYREKLWTKHVSKKQKMLSDMMEYVDICFGNARDAAKCLGYKEENMDFLKCDYRYCVDPEHMNNVLKYYSFDYLVTTLRQNKSASRNGFSAAVCSKEGLYKGHVYDLEIVDRVGSGDALAAGFLHSILAGKGRESALEFAIAAAALKHTMPGDISFFCEAEILRLIENYEGAQVVR